MKKYEGKMKKYEENMKKFAENMKNYAPLYMGRGTESSTSPQGGGSQILDLGGTGVKEMRHVNMQKLFFLFSLVESIIISYVGTMRVKNP